jgi:hypothetical protein
MLVWACRADPSGVVSATVLDSQADWGARHGLPAAAGRAGSPARKFSQPDGAAGISRPPGMRQVTHECVTRNGRFGRPLGTDGEKARWRKRLGGAHAAHGSGAWWRIGGRRKFGIAVGNSGNSENSQHRQGRVLRRGCPPVLPRAAGAPAQGGDLADWAMSGRENRSKIRKFAKLPHRGRSEVEVDGPAGALFNHQTGS